MLATSGGKKEAPAAKPTLAQVKDSVKIGASSKYVSLVVLARAAHSPARFRVCHGSQRGGGIVRAVATPCI